MTSRRLASDRTRCAPTRREGRPSDLAAQAPPRDGAAALATRLGDRSRSRCEQGEAVVVVRAEQDRMFDPAAQEPRARRASGALTTGEGASHAVMLPKPKRSPR